MFTPLKHILLFGKTINLLFNQVFDDSFRHFICKLLFFVFSNEIQQENSSFINVFFVHKVNFFEGVDCLESVHVWSDFTHLALNNLTIKFTLNFFTIGFIFNHHLCCNICVTEVSISRRVDLEYDINWLTKSNLSNVNARPCCNEVSDEGLGHTRFCDFSDININV